MKVAKVKDHYTDEEFNIRSIKNGNTIKGHVNN